MMTQVINFAHWSIIYIKLVSTRLIARFNITLQEVILINKFQKDQNLELLSRIHAEVLQRSNQQDRIAMYQQCFQQVLSVIDQKQGIIKLDETKLIERTFEIIQAIAKIDLKSLRKSKEIIDQMQKGDTAYQYLQRILQRRELAVQTDVFGISRRLEDADASSHDPGLLEPLTLRPSRFQQGTQQTQTEMTSQDLSYMEFREKEQRLSIDALQDQHIKLSQHQTTRQSSKPVQKHFETEVTEFISQEIKPSPKIVSSRIKSKALKIVNKAGTPTVYQKLVDDGEERQQRLQSMRDQLHDMERKHWIDVLQIMNHCDTQQYSPKQSKVVQLQKDKIRLNQTPKEVFPPNSRKLGIEFQQHSEIARGAQTSPRCQTTRADFFFKRNQRSPKQTILPEEKETPEYEGSVVNERSQDAYQRRRNRIRQLEGFNRMSTTHNSSFQTSHTPFEVYLKHQKRMALQRQHMIQRNEKYRSPQNLAIQNNGGNSDIDSN